MILNAYGLYQFYVIETENAFPRATLAIAIDDTREKAESKALETAARRLARTRTFDPDLTVGG